MAEKDNKKKQIPLRLSAQLYNAIAAGAEELKDLFGDEFVGLKLFVPSMDRLNIC